MPGTLEPERLWRHEDREKLRSIVYCSAYRLDPCFHIKSADSLPQAQRILLLFRTLKAEVMKTDADHSGRAVWGINRLRPLEHWGRGFEFH
jgi:hypothetical protein